MKEIYFIRYCKNSNDIEEGEIIKFYENIKNINSDLLFKFVLISDCENLIISDNLINSENFIYINLNNFIDEEVINETNDYFKTIKSYKCIFSIIKPSMV